MRKKSLFILLSCLMSLGIVHAQEQKADSLTKTTEKSNRDLLLNAASASQPRQISLGLPVNKNSSYIYEDGLPVSYNLLQLYPYKSWHSGVSHESVRTMSPQEMVLKYGVISYSVDSKTRLAGDKFDGRVNYTLNQFGRQALDANISTPIGKGWGISVGSYQNFDPGSNATKMTTLLERVQFYKGSLSKSFGEGRGKAGLIYQYSRFRNHIENFGPFIFVGDGSVKELDGFDLGHDSYRPADNYLYFLDLGTGQMKEQHVDDANTDKIHNVNFVLDYAWDNGTKLAVHSKYKNGHSYRANPTIAGVTTATEGSGITYADGTPYVGLVQNRRYLRFDAFEKSWMTNAELTGYSSNRRHHWLLEADYWLTSGGTETSMWMAAHEVKKDPKSLYVNGNSGFSYNSYAEYYKGHEHKLFAIASDEWNVSNRLWLYAGLRLEYLNVRGHAANDTSKGNRRHTGFSLVDEGVEKNYFNNKHFNYSYIASGRLSLLPGFGLQAEYSSSTIHSHINNYGVYPYPTQKGIVSNYFRGGIFWKNSWIDLTSQITYIEKNNAQERPSFSHVLTKDVGNMKAGQEENVTIPLYYDLGAMGWLTDAVVTPFKGFSVHMMFTMRNPQYKNFKLTPTFSDGISEEHDFSGNNITALSKTELEIEPSYSFDKWRIWLSARYFSKQYINKTNSLYFNGRWETFGGVDYKLNKQVSFSLSIVNILNQKGASGSISSADLVTDSTPYKNYVMAGTFIRPFTLELTTKLVF